MKTEKEINNLSKFFSLILRHKPETIGIKLDENGWVNTTVLLEKSNQHGHKIDFETLKIIVETNNKKRFSFSDDFEKIRANQGHSLDIELGYLPTKPPKILFHGTAEKNINSIKLNGLEKRNRHHVHLSQDIETALNVGKRHGKPIVLEIHSEEMYNHKFDFFLSENGVWLTEKVPTIYIKEQSF
ncbi:RNA 2'-phosphotransferase [Flavobacterium psychrophilum]|nr:RNA 2'-phosphotransferase [Flavobacterium psychrophilum]